MEESEEYEGSYAVMEDDLEGYEVNEEDMGGTDMQRLQQYFRLLQQHLLGLEEYVFFGLF